MLERIQPNERAAYDFDVPQHSKRRCMRVCETRAVLNGLASDGGLYVTDALGETKIDLERVVTNTYRENAAYILGTLLDDYSAEEIESCVEAAYKGTFETDDVAPVVKVGDAFVLELFRGPTQVPSKMLRYRCFLSS